MDQSLAGKCYRKKQSLKWDDVTQDRDWSANPETKSTYKALICIPLGTWGVLSIDGLKAMDEECSYIAETYASIIEGAADEHNRAMLAQEHEEFMSRLVMEEEAG